MKFMKENLKIKNMKAKADWKKVVFIYTKEGL